MPRYGIVSILLIPLGLILPIHAAIQAAGIAPRRDEIEGDRKRVAGLRVCLALSIGVALPTEYLLPLLEIPFPRLGALGASIASAVVWLVVLHRAEDLKVTPRGVAREVLAELRDGVALLDLDGAILSANARFVEMCGRTGGDLLGTSLGALLDAPVDRIIGGVEDRESSLHAADGTTIPVALSSSIARNRQGRLIGIVVAVCDRREIDELRRQLLSSGRLAAIGELAAGIAHEVNNPVAFVRSDLNLLAERVGELRHEVAGSPLGLDHLTVFDRVRDRIERAHERLGRVAQVVVDIREFAHVGGAGQGGSDPESVVLGAMRLARMQRGEEVSIRVASVSGSDRCDSGQELKQILLVLLRLLAEGVEKGGAIDAELRTDARDLVVGLRASPLAKGAHDLRERIETLTGSGGEADAISVGLASASELIEQLGGHLVVDAVSTIELRLELTIPLAAQSAGEGRLL
jgi:signal transduction histidine kinase